MNLQQNQRTHNLPTAEEIAVIIPEDCKGDWGTRLQENPQLILQFAIMIQFTSRRILRD